MTPAELNASKLATVAKNRGITVPKLVADNNKKKGKKMPATIESVFH